MVLTMKDLEEGLDKHRTQLTNELRGIVENSIAELREHVINQLVESNKRLQTEVSVLKQEVHNLNLELQKSLQYNRLNNILISGIPEEVEHRLLEKASLAILNKCLEAPIGTRDLEACHRLSAKSNTVVCRLVNRRNVEEALENWGKLAAINKEEVGLPPTTGNIFFNPHLTPYGSKIAYQCRQLKKEGKIKNISTKKGIIKIQFMDDSGGDGILRWRVISHVNELTDLFPPQ